MKLNNVLDKNLFYILSITQAEKLEISKGPFIIPKNIWIFSQESSSYLHKKCIENIKFYSSSSGFNIQPLNLESSNSLLSKQGTANLKKIMAILRQKGGSKNKKAIQRLQKRLVLLNFLKEYGGISIQSNLAMAQSIKWIESIVKNKLVNRGTLGVQPQIVGFYRPEYLSQNDRFHLEPQNRTQEIYQTVIQFPVVQDFFLAAGRNTLFLPAYIKTIYNLLENVKNFNSMKEKYKLKDIKNGQYYQEVFYVACQILLREKQLQLDERYKGQSKHFAFDFYGLNLINGYYGPLKMQMLYELQPLPTTLEQYSHKVYYDVSHTSIQQYTSLYGPIKYLFRLPFQHKMGQYIQKSSKNTDIVIYQDSIIHKIIYPEDQKYNFITRNPFYSIVSQKNIPWSTLPNIIWVYEAQGIANSSLFSQLCYDRLKSLHDDQFEVREVNYGNVKSYITPELYQAIEKTLEKVSAQNKQSFSRQFYRLAILQKQGGIFINPSSLAVQSFDWVLSIAKMPSQYIYNRFSILPKVLMMWHPFLNQPQSWEQKEIEEYKMIRTQWNQALLDSFIATQKNNQLIKQWLNTLLQFSTISSTEVSSKFEQYGIEKYRATGESYPVELSLDTVRYVLAKRQKQIGHSNNQQTVNSADYYKLWTFNAFISPYKLHSEFNYEMPGKKLVPFLFRYSQEYVEEIVGKIKYFLTISEAEALQIDAVLKSHINGGLKSITHPKSILMKYLSNSINQLLPKIIGIQSKN